IGLEYPEYLSPADDVLPAEKQPLPTAVLPTAESPGYIIDSEPEMEPEEEDGDDEKSEEDSIEYLTSRGYDDSDDDSDDLSKDDADDDDEEESSNSKDEEEEHLALTSIYGSDKICHTIYIYSSTTVPSIGTPPLLPTSSFPLPLFLLSTSGGESLPEADMPL
nr:hypothetical protein [Tanacetum cinerariifolium]